MAKQQVSIAMFFYLMKYSRLLTMRFLYYIFYFLFFGWIIEILLGYFSFSNFRDTLKKQPHSLNLFQFVGVVIVVLAYYVFNFYVSAVVFFLLIIGQIIFIAFLTNDDSK
jgi:hypothetical protein